MNLHLIDNTQARLNVTHGGENGEFQDPVLWDRTDAQILETITEAVRAGSVPGIKADPTASFTGDRYVVERFAATAEVPHNRFVVRPKVPYGGGEDIGGED